MQTKFVAMVAVAMAAMIGMTPNAAAATAATGYGELTYPGCPPSDHSVFSGVNDGAGWTFTVEDQPDADCFWAADGGVFQGSFTPLVGGSLAGVLPGTSLSFTYSHSLAGTVPVYNTVLCGIWGWCVSGQVMMVHA